MSYHISKRAEKHTIGTIDGYTITTIGGDPIRTIQDNYFIKKDADKFFVKYTPPQPTPTPTPPAN